MNDCASDGEVHTELVADFYAGLSMQSIQASKVQHHADGQQEVADAVGITAPLMPAVSRTLKDSVMPMIVPNRPISGLGVMASVQASARDYTAACRVGTNTVTR